MDYLRDHPEKGFSVVSINVQDLTHPADFFQVLLDGFHDAHPDFVRDQLAAGWKLVSGVLGKVDEIGVGGFKLGLRESDPDWRTNWRQHGDTFLAQTRKTGAQILFIIDEFQRERFGATARNPVAGDGTPAGRSRRHTPSARTQADIQPAIARPRERLLHRRERGRGLRLRQRRPEIVVEEILCLSQPSIRTSACTDPA